MFIAPLLMLMQTVVLQPGANPNPQAESELPIPRRKKEQRQHRSAEPASPLPKAAPPREEAECRALVRSDPATAARMAQSWLDKATDDAARRAPRLCLGMAQAAQMQWGAAEQTFTALALATPVVTGPDAAANEDAIAFRAMAGTTALAGGFPERAIVWLDQAAAGGTGLPPEQRAGIAIDRAQALVRLGRLDDARKALDEARQLAPGNAEGWLLSATLYRRQRDLAAAQRDIEQAGSLDPRDPAIGLEAGVIAMLDGREASARKSWDSVIATAPGSNEAQIARGYLDQIGPGSAANAPAFAKTATTKADTKGDPQ